jgi:integrase
MSNAPKRRHRRTLPSERSWTSGEKALDPSQVEPFLAKVAKVQDLALLRLAIVSGMRREDVVGVTLAGVDLAAGKVSFYERKKRRTWTAWVDPDTIVTLKRHIGVLPKGTEWLFPSPWSPKRHISSRHAYDVLQRWLDETGLDRRPFHALRASCVKYLKSKGWSPEAIMKQTGDRLETIMQHYSTPSDDEMHRLAAGVVEG